MTVSVTTGGTKSPVTSATTKRPGAGKSICFSLTSDSFI